MHSLSLLSPLEILRPIGDVGYCTSLFLSPLWMRATGKSTDNTLVSRKGFSAPPLRNLASFWDLMNTLRWNSLLFCRSQQLWLSASDIM